tara:strand:- start:1526 stop:1984 length:459 start_codon:yes stop_codon:yes gene_type:complete
MRKIFGTIAVVLLMISCGENNSENISTDLVKNPATADDADSKEGLPIMTFETDLREFGTIVQGDRARMTFEFTNTGESDLIISSASASCGCTVPEYPKTPISPGESGTIEVLFNSDGKMGRQHKKVYIVANTNPSTNVVAISGDVVGPDENN